VRSRTSSDGLQRITTAKNASTQDFQDWLRHKNLGSDVYVGRNCLKVEAQERTKDDIETIRHLYLDIGRKRTHRARSHGEFGTRTTAKLRP